MGVLGQLVAQPLRDEDLPRRVREMLLGTDHVGDLHVVVVDDVGEVVQARPVGALDDVVLLGDQSTSIVAADVVDELAGALARHLQAHAALAALAPRNGRGRRRSRPSSGGCRARNRFAFSAAVALGLSSSGVA